MTSSDSQPEDADAPHPLASEWAPSQQVEENSIQPTAAGAKERVLPQPGVLVAAALTTVPVISQFVVVGALIIVVPLLFLIVTGRPDELMEFGEKLQVFLFPVGASVTLLVAITVCWVFFGRNMGRKVAWRGVSIGQLICVLALIVPLAVLASEVTNCVDHLMRQLQVDWLREFHEQNADMFLGFVSQPWWFVFVSACLLPGLGEEIYCRGLLSHGLIARCGVVGGTLLAAGMFGAMHIEPVQAIGAFTLGIALQFVFLATRSIAAPIVLHTLHNSLAFLTMKFADTFSVPGLTPTSDGSVSHTPLAVLVMAALTAVVVMAIMFQNRTRWRLPDGTDWSPGYVTAEIPDASFGAIVARETPSRMLVMAGLVAFGLLIATIIYCR